MTHDLGVGGLPRVVETLCRTIDPTRFEVSVLCLNAGGELADALRTDGYAVHVLDRPGGKPDYLSGFRVSRFLREGAYDVVHSHNTQPLLDAALGSLLAGRPVLVHTDHARDFPDKLRYMVLEHISAWRAYRVVGVSAHTTECLHAYERIPRRKLHTIVNGIDARLFERPIDVAAVRASTGVPAGARIALFASRLEPQKDVANLLAAFALLDESVRDLHLVIAGQGGLRPQLEEEARIRGLSSRVHFVGVRLDVPDLLRASDVFVLSSRWEGLPMVVLEALAAGCPVVSTAVGGVPTAIEDEHTGLLVPPQDAQALASALTRMVSDAALRSRISDEGRKVFASRFSATAMTRAYEALYVDGLRARHGRQGIT